jgi:hypothetical protein
MTSPVCAVCVCVCVVCVLCVCVCVCVCSGDVLGFSLVMLKLMKMMSFACVLCVCVCVCVCVRAFAVGTFNGWWCCVTAEQHEVKGAPPVEWLLEAADRTVYIPSHPSIAHCLHTRGVVGCGCWVLLLLLLLWWWWWWWWPFVFDSCIPCGRVHVIPTHRSLSTHSWCGWLWLLGVVVDFVGYLVIWLFGYCYCW